MGQMTGMDIQAVRQLAKVFKQKSDEIERISREVTSKLQSVQWVGKDRTKFEGDWNGQGKAQLKNVATMLEQAGQKAEQNATQQEQASNN